MATPATAPKAATPTDVLTCPECGRTFSRAAALGAHRKAAHGIAGTSKKTAAKSARSGADRKATRARRASAAAATVRETGRTATGRVPQTVSPRRRVRVQPSTGNGGGSGVDRDALLRALFPQGIPPRQEVIGAVNEWLNEAERLANTR